LRHIQPLLERPRTAPTTDDPSESSRFAYLNEKTSNELRAMREDIQRSLARFETALRIGTSVLGERQP
jgi:hypothetical protein